MSSKAEHILIFGATGLIGKHITNAIVENASQFSSISIFTSSNTLSSKADQIDALKARGVKVIAGDITSEKDVNEAYSGIDTIVSCVGRPVIQTQLLLVELAEKHPDVRWILPSEYG